MLEVLAVVFVAQAPAVERPRLAVFELVPQGAVAAADAAALTEALTADLGARGFFDIVSQRELQTMVGLERQRQLMGCTEGQSCLAELSAALGARFVTTGTLSRLGAGYQLSLSTLDTQKGQALGRATRVAADVETLRRLMPYLAAEASGLPPPAPPSRALSFTLLGVGGAATLFGIVWGTLQLGREQELASSLERGEALSSLATYQDELRRLRTQQLLAAVALAAGVGVGVAGIVLMPRDASVQVSLVPSSTGVSVVGVFP